MIGSFKIRRVLGTACQLELPAFMKIHDAIHTSSLRPAVNEPLPEQMPPEAPPVETDNEDE